MKTTHNPAMVRSIDHVVLPVHSLDSVHGTLERLGFTATPRAEHPWGTANRLVQLDGVFLEYLEIADEAAFPDTGSATAFDFARFNRDWLQRLGEGASMLVVTSRDAAQDREGFLRAGLRVHDSFGFERTARLPDGSARKVAFSLTFVTDPALPDMAFFACQHHYPENFWKPDYQRHANGARDLAGVVIVADNPADHQILFSGLAGERDIRSTGLGIEIAAGRHAISVMTPVGYERRFGATYERLDQDRATIAALRLLVADLASARTLLETNEVAFENRPEALVVPSAECHGCAMIFEQG